MHCGQRTTSACRLRSFRLPHRGHGWPALTSPSANWIQISFSGIILSRTVRTTLPIFTAAFSAAVLAWPGLTFGKSFFRFSR